MIDMKIGDKVRFLNAVGGGVVKGFQNKDVVLVEEDDGFETPVLIRECIVISSPGEPAQPSVQKANSKPEVQREDVKPEPKEYAYEETPAGERLNVYLAYLPMGNKNIGKCNYEAYLINESNYFLFFNYMSRENNAWISRQTELVEPNTRLFLEEFSKDQLNDLEKICIQLIAFKKDKPYSLKNTYSVELRIDGVKFYKLHCFRENDFFEEDALIYPVITNDRPEREMLVSASDLQEAMTEKNRIDTRRKITPVKKKESLIVEVDLHIGQLLDTTAGMSNTDMLEVQLAKFHNTIEEYKNKKGQKIVFIHGKGEGVLRNAILTELRTKYKNYPVQDASFKEYGFGATMITIK
ncbi:DUF2027 domain-containing protein [Bacteroidales bacterium OttesenSCG-928-A17]|nr:DUF2027 domain-containing protein [Bacteroidales bacterium OttesenSCG-928-A17]